MDGKAVLDIPMDENDGDAKTVREYLQALLRRLWVEGEGFSGKRPFGNSGWEHDVAFALVKAGAIPGSIDEEYGEATYDDREALSAVLDAIDALGEAE